MKHVKLFEQFLNEAVSPNAVIRRKREWLIGSQELINALKKSASDLGKMALAGAYRDDADIVNKKTSKTMVTVTDGMTIAQAADAINAWAERN